MEKFFFGCVSKCYNVRSSACEQQGIHVKGISDKKKKKEGSPDVV